MATATIERIRDVVQQGREKLPEPRERPWRRVRLPWSRAAVVGAEDGVLGDASAVLGNGTATLAREGTEALRTSAEAVESAREAVQSGAEALRSEAEALRAEADRVRVADVELPELELPERGDGGGNRGRKLLALAVSGLGLGAAAAYLLDPRRGGLRRSQLRDRFISIRAKAPSVAAKTARDAANRTKGLLAEARASLRNEQVTDEVLTARVRSAIGRAIAHGRGVEVGVREGVVTLSGPVLQREHETLVDRVRLVRGVARVEDQLEVHEQPGNVPALQGEAKPATWDRFELLQEHWSPTARAATVAGGSLLAVFGVIRRGRLGIGMLLAGLALAARGATNVPLGRLLGLAGGRRGVDVRKSIIVQAPVEEVFGLWQRFEEFPRFMAHVKEVSRGEDGRSHWVVRGPGGTDVEFDAELTKAVPNRELAWKTLPGQPLAHAGIVRFDPTGEGTRVDVRMSYNPPAGAVGHLISAILGDDPKQALDNDLVRFKSLLEEGKTTADQQEVRREEVAPA